MTERFRKYHGLGNDFVVIDRLDGGEPWSPDRVRAVCERHRGVGADGVLTIWPMEGGHGQMQIQNADGSDSEMCGNGLRCVAAYLHDTGRTADDSLILGAMDQRYPVERVRDHRYRAVMGKAQLSGPDLPTWAGKRELHHFTVDGKDWRGVALGFGNPHLVVFVDEDPMDLARRWGDLLERDPAFRSRVNASFVHRRGNVFDAVVYERGVGITQACGSGACAVGNAAVWTGQANAGEPIDIQLPGGVLAITVDQEGTTTMEGDAALAFVGELP